MAAKFAIRLRSIFKNNISFLEAGLTNPHVGGYLFGAEFKITFIEGNAILAGNEVCFKIFISIIKDFINPKAIFKFDARDKSTKETEHCVILAQDSEIEILQGLLEENVKNLRSVDPNKQWYINSALKKKSGEKETRIFGHDTGLLTKEEINSLSEIETLDKIDELTCRIYIGLQRMQRGLIPDFDIESAAYDVDYLKYSTKRFGVDIDQNIHIASGRIMESEDYKAWYKYYSDHFKIRMSDDERIRYKLARENHEDISEFMPPLSYREYKLQKEKQI